METTTPLPEAHQSCVGTEGRGCTASSGWVRRRRVKANMTTDSAPRTQCGSCLGLNGANRAKENNFQRDAKKKEGSVHGRTTQRAKGKRVKGYELYSKWTLKWPTRSGRLNNVHIVTDVSAAAMNSCWKLPDALWHTDASHCIFITKQINRALCQPEK